MKDYALVTGGSQGIGLAICRRLKEDGATPIIFDRVAPADPDLGEFREVDLSDTGATAAALEWALALGPVSRLVNNVGMVLPALLEDTSLEDFDTLMALNVRCAIQCTKTLAPAMRERGMGRIVNIASRAAFRGDTPDYMQYAASKGGLVSLTRSLARGFAADNILAYVVAPGFVRTEMAEDFTRVHGEEAITREIPLGDMASPEDVAEVVLFLASGRARHATGTTIDINGASYVR